MDDEEEQGLPLLDDETADLADRRAEDADVAARRADIRAAVTDALRDRATLTPEEAAAHAQAAADRAAAASKRLRERAERVAAARARTFEPEREQGPAVVSEVRRGATYGQPLCPACGRSVDPRFGVAIGADWYHRAHVPEAV